MSEQFEVGEIAIVQNAVRTAFNGEECRVIGGLERRLVRNPISGEVFITNAYHVAFAGDAKFHALPHQLRKKRPPQQYTGELRIREMFDAAPVKQPAEIA